jgi:hypothetical protein
MRLESCGKEHAILEETCCEVSRGPRRFGESRSGDFHMFLASLHVGAANGNGIDFLMQ